MTGIDFADTIVVRRVVEKGTRVIKEQISPQNYEEDMEKKKIERLKLAGDLMILSGKGTSKIRLSEMKKPKAVLPKGHYIVTNKGTGRKKL